MSDQFTDDVVELDIKIHIEDIANNLSTQRLREELDKHFMNPEWINHLKKTYGETLPYFFMVMINDKWVPLHMTFLDQQTRVPIDWVYYSGLKKVDEKAINDEPNSAKKWLLMQKFGLEKFEDQMEVLAEDARGVLLKHHYEGEDFYYVKVIDDTAHEELKGKDGCTADGRKIYFISTSSQFKTPTEAVAASWGINPKLLDNGWTAAA